MFSRFPRLFIRSRSLKVLPRIAGVLINRFIQGGVKAAEWPRYVREVYRILRPGGYAQMGEPTIATPISEHNSLPHDAPMAEVHLPRRRRPAFPNWRGDCADL